MNDDAKRTPKRGLPKQVVKTFAYHKPSEIGKAQIEKLRAAYSALYDELQASGIPSRELSVAVTYLETSAMWAVKSVVHNDPNSTVEAPPIV